jgi:hypothetical protein
MIRFFARVITLSAILAPLAVWADPPHFSSGGFNFQIQYGPGFWTVDQAKLGSDPGVTDAMGNRYVVGPTNAELFKTSLQNTHTVSLSAAYNIMGHASIGADLTATGWNLFDVSRGGGGMVIGKVAWHPLELFFMKKEKRPIGIDASTFFGVGYGIVGGATSVAGFPNGMDGLLFEWGANVDYFFARYFGLGFFARGVFLNWDKFYLDFNNRDVPGNSIALAKPLGGSFWTFGISMTFRAGE